MPQSGYGVPRVLDQRKSATNKPTRIELTHRGLLPPHGCLCASNSLLTLKSSRTLRRPGVALSRWLGPQLRCPPKRSHMREIAGAAWVAAKQMAKSGGWPQNSPSPPAAHGRRYQFASQAGMSARPRMRPSGAGRLTPAWLNAAVPGATTSRAQPRDSQRLAHKHELIERSLRSGVRHRA